MREPLVNRDPGDETLFNPAQRCPLRTCGTTRRNLCRHDADHHNTPPAERPPRPRGCIATTFTIPPVEGRP